MPLDRGDPALLLDILQAAQAIVRFLGTKTHEEFRADELLQSAVERKLEIVGEAARYISKTLQDANPHIPWKKIMATRHILAHDYDTVNKDIVWRIATVYIPELIASLAPLVPALPPDPDPNP